MAEGAVVHANSLEVAKQKAMKLFDEEDRYVTKFLERPTKPKQDSERGERVSKT